MISNIAYFVVLTKTKKIMKQIRLIPSDFDSLDCDEFYDSGQFQENSDCPIARALKRVAKEPNSVSVGVSCAYIDGQKLLIQGRYPEVDKCRESLRICSEFSIIKVIQ